MDRVLFLVSITGDMSWFETPDRELVNADGKVAEIVMENGMVTLKIGGRQVYHGPAEVEVV